MSLDFSNQKSDTADGGDSSDSARNAAPAAGLLFQAPDPTVVVAPRRRSEPEQAEQRESAPDHSDLTSSEDEDEDQPRTRRRRGGRGRARSQDDENSVEDAPEQEDAGSGSPKRGSRAKKNSDAKAEASSTPGAAVEQGESAGERAEAFADGDADGDDAAGGRRRRRRRRSGAAGDTQDPPGTVTKVREPRTARDEVTSIKGSTRLEAKKQRRREGREAGRRRTVITEAEFLARRESVDRQMVVREREGRIQIGVLEDDVLVEHYVSRQSQQASMAGSVYLGRVQNVLPSMEAAFVDIGKGRNAVLYAGEVNWDAAGLTNNQPRRIENALKGGSTVLVQVTKDPIGHKGARLTSQISLPGRYLVYVPGNSMTGISRRLPDTERARLKKILKEVVPADAGVIVRTAAEGASEAELHADVQRLTAAWEKISAEAKASKSAPVLLHGESEMTVRVIRDVFNEDFSKLTVSGDDAWAQISEYVESVAPDLVSRLEKWTGEKDVFAAHRIDEQLAKAMDRKVWLPSGGSLIIDRTEAMTVIDVNTGKFVGSGGNLEETVTRNNIEAAEEIVRQLRLRDIGGIIVVDFIDMVLEANRELVVRRMLECLGRDRTKHQVAEVTSLGLVQMTRKRVGAGLIEVFSESCDHCGGRGLIVHDQPVDKDADADQSAGGGSGESKPGRKNKRGKSEKPAKNAPLEQAEKAEKVDGNGRTAAQIAAAAHAAATRSELSDDTADLQGNPAGVSDRAPEGPSAPVTSAATTIVEPPVARPRRKRGRVSVPAGSPGQSSEASASTGNGPDATDNAPEQSH